jgi:hypothetical protein
MKTKAISIGEFTLTVMSDGTFFISNEDGERGEFSAEKFEELVSKFFWDNF